MRKTELLRAMKVRDLKREISKQNIKGYSKKKKAEVIVLILKNKKRFSHLWKKTRRPKDKTKTPVTIKKKERRAKSVLKNHYFKHKLPSTAHTAVHNATVHSTPLQPIMMI